MTAACQNSFGTPERRLLPDDIDNFEIGQIYLWPNSIASIPDEFILCDGNNGTPDLRNIFVPAAGGVYAVDDSGGNVDHIHAFTGNGHTHTHGVGTDLTGGGGINPTTTNVSITGNTDSAASLPVFRRLAYIMFIGG